jgi:hypothetical protein
VRLLVAFPSFLPTGLILSLANNLAVHDGIVPINRCLL